MLFVPIVVVVAVVAVVDVEFATGTPCGGKGGGISSLSFRAVFIIGATAAVDVVVAAVGGITADGLTADFAAKLFRATLSLLE